MAERPSTNKHVEIEGEVYENFIRFSKVLTAARKWRYTWIKN